MTYAKIELKTIFIPVVSNMKTFTTTGVCTPENNYMVDISERVEKMKVMVDEGKYFTINRSRQYGKTTTLTALAKRLKEIYVVLSVDFQGLDYGSFSSGGTFSQAFAQMLIDEFEFNYLEIPQTYIDALDSICKKESEKVRMSDLFRVFKRLTIKSQ